MKIIKSIIPSLLLLAGPVAWAADTPVISPASLPADPMTTEALPILKARYADFSALHYKEGDHLTDLITRSNGKISLVTPDVIGPVPIITASLPDGVIYWRLASFTPKKDWAELGGELKAAMATPDLSGAILDLRSNMDSNDYAGARQVLSFFAPSDTSLLPEPILKAESASLAPLTLDHPFQAPLVVLVDPDTNGLAEALASRLQVDGALVIGHVTAGSAAYEDHKLASGEVLRFAVAMNSGMFSVTPDISLSVNDHNEKAALALIRDDHIGDVIQEGAARHRLSEASLVKGQDPEFDDYLQSLERKPVLLSLPVVHDPVLISALDSLRAIRLSQRPLPVDAASNAPASTGPASVQ
jgi:hypothetical protein